MPERLLLPYRWIRITFFAALPYILSVVVELVTPGTSLSVLAQTQEMLVFAMMSAANALNDFGRFREEVDIEKFPDLKLYWLALIGVLIGATFIFGIDAFAEKTKPESANKAAVLIFSTILALGTLTGSSLAQHEMVLAEQDTKAD